MPRPDPLPHLGAVAAALDAPDQPAAGFAALEAALGAAIGHRLFTILLHDAAGGWNARIHSNQPARYPIGGRKPITGSAWMTQVIREGRPWIGRDEADIRWAFFDHALIRSLGCDSALNLPVRWQGRTLGTLNLLHEAGWYGPADAVVGGLFAGLAVPVLLAARPPAPLPAGAPPDTEREDAPAPRPPGQGG